jgi:formylglycine-generating enzyme required for sulfatase activity
MKKHVVITAIALLAMTFAAGTVGAAEKKKTKKVAKSEVSQNFTDATSGIEFVSVPGGCFRMGDTFGDGNSNEKPVHEVCVDGLYVGKYPVTQIQWERVMGTTPSNFFGKQLPVEQVSWNGAQTFISRLNRQSGKKYRLPTEAEWEYAAKGGKEHKYAGTNSTLELEDYAWYDQNSGAKTHPVGEKKPNPFGLYDMSGNVWQWISDWYGENYYSNSPKDNPQGPSGGSDRVLRGGCWYLSAWDARSSDRSYNSPDYRSLNFGFRLVLPPVR